MKAAFIEKYGSATNLVVGELETPKINEDQLLIRVVASGVNPVDFHIRKGFMADTDTHNLPLVLGWDCAGVVEKVGTNVTHFVPGDKVMSFTPIGQQGTNAEYVAVNASLVIPKPENMSFIEAAGLPLAGVTALQALTHSANVTKGSKVLIHNASGAVGSFAVQIAKALGANVVATASSKKHEYVEFLGADEVYSYNSECWRKQQYFDVSLVAKGDEELIYASLHATKQGGNVVSTLNEIPTSDAQYHQVNFERMWVTNCAESLNALISLFNDNELVVPIDTVFPLEQIKLAHERSENYSAVGKIVLIVDPHLKY